MFINHDQEADIDDVRDAAADFLEQQEEAYGVEEEPEVIQEKKIYAKGALRKVILSILVFFLGMGVLAYVAIFYLKIVTIPGLFEEPVVDEVKNQEVFDAI